jgi:hypothetical protein
MTKYCEFCGKEMTRKLPNEGPVLFSRRKFCNRVCSIAHFRKIGHWREYAQGGLKKNV